MSTSFQQNKRPSVPRLRAQGPCPWGRKTSVVPPQLRASVWWSWRDPTPRPPHCQCDALPLRHSPDALRSSTLITGVTPARASRLPVHSRGSRASSALPQRRLAPAAGSLLSRDCAYCSRSWPFAEKYTDYGPSGSRRIEIDWSTPRAKQIETSELPPWEMNGSGIPVTGMSEMRSEEHTSELQSQS